MLNLFLKKKLRNACKDWKADITVGNKFCLSSHQWPTSEIPDAGSLMRGIALEGAIAILCTWSIYLDHLKNNFLNRCTKKTQNIKTAKGIKQGVLIKIRIREAIKIPGEDLAGPDHAQMIGTGKRIIKIGIVVKEIGKRKVKRVGENPIAKKIQGLDLGQIDQTTPKKEEKW